MYKIHVAEISINLTEEGYNVPIQVTIGFHPVYNVVDGVNYYAEVLEMKKDGVDLDALCRAMGDDTVSTLHDHIYMWIGRRADKIIAGKLKAAKIVPFQYTKEVITVNELLTFTEGHGHRGLRGNNSITVDITYSWYKFNIEGRGSFFGKELHEVVYKGETIYNYQDGLPVHPIAQSAAEVFYEGNWIHTEAQFIEKEKDAIGRPDLVPQGVKPANILNAIEPGEYALILNDNQCLHYEVLGLNEGKDALLCTDGKGQWEQALEDVKEIFKIGSAIMQKETPATK